ncbi:MAG: sugar ABC transporter ATP-binding protein [Clostridiaceae bacterium BRH_c20a]|nr:MAG: sugar ABC transporter ATP-binding protein [Clostridiaceae bacterium BRH_c20a]
MITVKNLSKTFNVNKRQEGMLGAVRSLFWREYISKKAVDDISFNISPGEIVGYIGPNGAGKSTTIKMLTGILVPTSGEILVNGIVPFQNRQKNARQIGVVFGQRTQLWWDLPTQDSFELLKHIYQIPEQTYRQNMADFIDILAMEEFLDTPVRQLSLGQRMRADIAASLLHDPSILFLDEPTIGLDVVAKDRMRKFIQKINRERGVTVILTTHDMADIEKLCQRMILIDQGKIMYDGELSKVKEVFGAARILIIDLEGDAPFEEKGVELIREEGQRKWLKFNRDEISSAQLLAEIAKKYEIKDLIIQEPEIDYIIRKVYERGLNIS